IDHFKQVNDQYGHIIGDEVIQFVAQCLKDNVRTGESVRPGGIHSFSGITSFTV
ncbi:diguanylate cyclase, partial [Corynebacterium diphtheriae]